MGREGRGGRMGRGVGWGGAGREEVEGGEGGVEGGEGWCKEGGGARLEMQWCRGWEGPCHIAMQGGADLMPHQKGGSGGTGGLWRRAGRAAVPGGEGDGTGLGGEGTSGGRAVSPLQATCARPLCTTTGAGLRRVTSAAS